MHPSWDSVVRQTGLLIDTNLLVLRVIGDVNPQRVGVFKRVTAYTAEGYNLLRRLMTQAARLFTIPQVISEVSNLTDLSGKEREDALRVLRHYVLLHTETAATSRDACAHSAYERLGVTDSAILLTAERHGVAVLTNDLDLHLALQERGIPSANFTHLRNAIRRT